MSEEAWTWEPLATDPVESTPLPPFATWEELSAAVQFHGEALARVATEQQERTRMQTTQETAWTEMIGVLQRHTEAMIKLAEGTQDLAREMRDQREWLMRLKLTMSELVSALERQDRG
jgi:hypothetical protein